MNLERSLRFSFIHSHDVEETHLTLRTFEAFLFLTSMTMPPLSSSSSSIIALGTRICNTALLSDSVPGCTLRFVRLEEVKPASKAFLRDFDQSGHPVTNIDLLRSRVIPFSTSETEVTLPSGHWEKITIAANIIYFIFIKREKNKSPNNYQFYILIRICFLQASATNPFVAFFYSL